MKKFMHLNLVTCLLVPLFALLAVFPGSADAANVVTAKISCQMPADHFDSKAIEIFIKSAEKSNKTLRFQFFPASQLYSAQDLVDVLPMGGVEMAQIGLNRFAGILPVGDIAYPIFAGPDIYFRWLYDKKCGAGLFYRVLQPAFAKHNIHLISTLNYATTYAMITNKPVHSIADYKGMKIRTAGKNWGAVVEALGAKAVVMSSADVYMALQRGTIDGALSGTSSFVDRKWYEAAKYIQLLPMGDVPFGFAASMKFWNQLSADQKKAIDEAARKMEIWAVQASKDSNGRSMAVLKKAGEKIYSFPKDVENKITRIGIRAVKKTVEPDVGKKTWNQAMKYLENARAVNEPTWQEMLKTRSFN